MFRFSTIIRELVLNLAKVIFTLKVSVKLSRYLLCGCVTACCRIHVCNSVLRSVITVLTAWNRDQCCLT